jgi:two-component system OmpR family response regulator
MGLPSILLVEDDRMLCDALAAALRQDSWHVDVAHDGRSAQTALIDHGYAALLLDLGLPNGSGLEVLSVMRARYDATPACRSEACERAGRAVAPVQEHFA